MMNVGSRGRGDRKPGRSRCIAGLPPTVGVEPGSFPASRPRTELCIRNSRMKLGPVTGTGPGKRAVAVAVAALVLAAVPSDDLRADGAPTEAETSPRDILQRLGSAAERLQRAIARERERDEQIAALKGETGNLGGAASKAVGQWPAAQSVNPTWEWARVLVFLVQSALVAQGYDPGKLDGVMGPNTMMALLEWHAKSGEPREIGLVATIAYLLHATLKAHGLEPGPRDRFLGPRSKAALDRWGDIFHMGAVTAAAYGVDFFLTRSMVEGGFEQTRPANSGATASRSAGRESTDHSLRAGGESAEEALLSGSEGTKRAATEAHSKQRDLDDQKWRGIGSPWGKPARNCISLHRERDGLTAEYHYELKNNCRASVVLNYCLRRPLPRRVNGEILDGYSLCGLEGYEARISDDRKWGREIEPYCRKWVILNPRQYISGGPEAEAYRRAVPMHPIEGTIVDKCNYYQSGAYGTYWKPGEHKRILTISVRSRKPNILVAACLGQSAGFHQCSR